MTSVAEPIFQTNLAHKQYNTKPQEKWSERRRKLRTRGALERPILPERLFADEGSDFLRAADRCLVNQIAALSYLYFLDSAVRPLSYLRWHFQRPISLRRVKAGSRIAAYANSIARQLPLAYHFHSSEDRYHALVDGYSEWARCALSVHFDLSIIQRYRRDVAYDTDICPGFRRVMGDFYQQRLRSSELSVSVWCIESGAVSTAKREAVTNELIEIFDALDALNNEQAKADAAAFTAVSSTTFGNVKHLMIENIFKHTYRELSIADGMRVPRFRWQAKSILRREQFNRLYRELKAE